MKFVIATFVTFSLIGAANAGTLVFEAEEEQEIIIVEEEPMGASQTIQAVSLKVDGQVVSTSQKRAPVRR